MNKKMILVTSLALMLVTAGTAMAAPGNGQGLKDGTGTRQGTGQHMAYQDADGDGLCDLTGTPVGSRMGNGAGNANFVDADGDGLCDNAGTGGQNFVDADGDGACDIGGGTRPQDGSGMRRGGRTV